MIHPDVMLEAIEASGIDNGLGVVEEKMQSAYQGGGEYGRKVNAYWLPNHLFQVYVDGKPTGCRSDDPVEWKLQTPTSFRTASLAIPHRNPM